MTRIPELQSLIAAVEETFHAPVKTTAGFERLSTAIEYALGESLGASTLKRLWGYIPSRTTPRLTTLDILARYAGHKDFKAFCDSLHAEDSSDYLTDRSYITYAELSPGERVRIGWAPNRLVTLSYLGDGSFIVLESANSKLRPDDVFEATCLLKGWPLYVPGIHRGNILTPPYIAGKAHGLSLIEKVESY